jgi:hypothetical protein
MPEIACYGKAMTYRPANCTRVRIPSALRRAVLSIGAASALTGCSDRGPAYPSLASRPAERLTDTAEPASPAPDSNARVSAASALPSADLAPPSADLATRLDQLIEQAHSGYRTFSAKRAAAERQVSAAGTAPPGSEGWAQATQALSGIESARTQTAQPLSDLDRIEIEDRMAHPAQSGPDGNAVPRPDAIAIAQARDTVSALVTEEDAVLEKLAGRLNH